MKTNVLSRFCVLVVLLGLAALTSCNHNNYVHRTNYVPSGLFEKKGDAQLAGVVSFLPGLYAGYAITNHIGVVASLYGEQIGKNLEYVNYDSLGNSLGKAVYEQQRNGFQFAGVYYGRVGILKYEAQAGYGIFDLLTRVNRSGDMRGTPFDFNRDVSRIYQSFHLQPAIGAKLGKVDLMCGVRMQHLTYEIGQEPYADFIAESFVQMRAGWEHLKFSFQCGTLSASNNGQYRYYPIHMGLGVALDLNLLNK